jgi:thiol-disulfide isomerase/thioredoxin
MFKHLFATVLFLIAPSLSLAYDGGTGPRALSRTFNTEDSVGEVPDILFKEGAGRERTLHDYLQGELRGRYVLLSLWATWCVPCLSEMPSLNRLQAAMAPYNLTVLALSVDREGGITVPAYFRRSGLNNLKVAWAPSGSPLRRLHARGIPTTLLISPKGEEIGRVASYVDWARPDNVSFLIRLIDQDRNS